MPPETVRFSPAVEPGRQLAAVLHSAGRGRDRVTPRPLPRGTADCRRRDRRTAQRLGRVQRIGDEKRNATRPCRSRRRWYSPVLPAPRRSRCPATASSDRCARHRLAVPAPAPSSSASSPGARAQPPPASPHPARRESRPPAGAPDAPAEELVFVVRHVLSGSAVISSVTPDVASLIRRVRLPGAREILVRHHQPARQNAEAAVHDAHARVEHDGRDPRIRQQPSAKPSRTGLLVFRTARMRSPGHNPGNIL